MTSHTAPVANVAIIGAGIAGLSCALALRQAGLQVTVFERDGWPGGRMASKNYGDLHFDSGAQYFTVRSDVFRDQVQSWRERWLVEEWPAWLVDLDNGEALSHNDGVSRFIGRPQMHSFIEDMAELCTVRYHVDIEKLRYKKREQQWELIDSQRSNHGHFDAVVVAVPGPLAVRLLKESKALAKQAASVNMTSCWAVMLAFEQPLHLGFDGAYVVDSDISWMVCDSGKIERDNARGWETWLLHCAPEWSDARRKKKPEYVIGEALAAMREVCRQELPAPVFSAAEWWPHAKAVNSLNCGCLFDSERRIAACGDWCYAPRVEGAYLSGLAAAGRILKDG